MGISGISIGQLLILLFALLIFLPLYLLPTILALYKNHPHKVPIIIINIFGGAIGGVGWLVSFIWCFITPSSDKEKSTYITSEIEKLHNLKESGALTQEEFEHQKVKLLNAQT